MFLFPAFLFGLLTYSLPVQGQDKVSTIYQQLQGAKSDTAKLRLLTEFAWEIHNSDSSQRFYLEAISLSEHLKENDYLAQNLNRFGITLRNHDLQEQALDYYERALVLSQKIGNKKEEGYALNNIAQIFRYQGFQQEALSYYKKAEAIFKDLNFSSGLGYTYIGLGNLYGELEDYTKAIHFLNKSLEIRDTGEMDRNYLVTIVSRGDFYLKVKNYDKAMGDYMTYLSHVKDVYPRGEMNAYRRIALLHVKKQEFERALTYAHMAIDLHDKSPSLEIILPVYQALSQYYAKNGNYPNAYKYERLFSEGKEILFEERISSYLTNLKIRSQENKIKALEMDKNMQEETALVKKAINAGLVFLLLISVIAIAIYKKSYKKERENLEQLAGQKREIQEQAEELNRLNGVKDKLFSILAHDLRGPLNSLRGLIQLLEEETLSPEEFKEVIPLLSQNVGNNSILLENLLMWSRSQMQGMQTLTENVSINQVFYENLEFIDHISKKKNLRIHNLISDDVVVKADQGMVDIVMRNLLTNAVKFTPEGGEIELTAQHDSEHWKIIIADSGVGIAIADIPKIFGDKFFTTSGTQKEKGSGLGLLLSKELIEKNKGKIWLDSIEGEGTTFYFTLQKA